MVSALVLMNCEVGAEDYVLRELGKIPAVKEAYFLYGIYDVAAIVEAALMETLNETITQRIRTLQYVKSTMTMMVVRKA